MERAGGGKCASSSRDAVCLGRPRRPTMTSARRGTALSPSHRHPHRGIRDRDRARARHPSGRYRHALRRADVCRPRAGRDRAFAGTTGYVRLPHAPCVVLAEPADVSVSRIEPRSIGLRFWRVSCAQFTHGRVHGDLEEIIWTPARGRGPAPRRGGWPRRRERGPDPGPRVIADRAPRRGLLTQSSAERASSRSHHRSTRFPSRRRRHGSCFSRCHVWRQPSRRGNTMRVRESSALHQERRRIMRRRQRSWVVGLVALAWIDLLLRPPVDAASNDEAIRTRRCRELRCRELR